MFSVVWCGYTGQNPSKLPVYGGLAKERFHLGYVTRWIEVANYVCSIVSHFQFACRSYMPKLVDLIGKGGVPLKIQRDTSSV